MSETVEINKDSTVEEKVAFLREHIKNKDTDNTLAIRNIYCLLSTQTLTDELFDDPTVIFKDIEEFSDIKTELFDDLQELKKEIAIAYLSVLTSCRVITLIKDGQLKSVPNLYSVLMGNLGIFTLNLFLHRNFSKITEQDLYIVPDAIQTMSVIIQPLSVLNNVVTTVFGGK